MNQPAPYDYRPPVDPQVSFLLARLAEDEARHVQTKAAWPTPRELDEAERWRRDIETKRAIIEHHRNWPVLLEGKTVVADLTDDFSMIDTLTLRMTRQVEWITQREYVERFGKASPTAPIIAILAAAYDMHPDYRDEWRH